MPKMTRQVAVLVTACVTVLAMLVTPNTAAAASAAPSAGAVYTSASASKSQELDPETEAIKAEVAALKKYLSKDLELDYTAAAGDPRISRATLDEYATWYMAAGETVLGATADVVALESAVSNVEEELAAVSSGEGVSILACSGRNGWRTWYPTVFLDSCATNAVISAYAIGAGVAGMAALITAWTGAGPAIAGVIAGALSVSGGIVGLCGSWGRGIQVFVAPWGSVCWSQ